MVVHGIPGSYALGAGDVISIDVGVTLDGWVADAARTFAVGEIDPVAQNLLAATRESLHAGVEQCRAGNRMGDLSSAIQRVAEGAGLSVVRSLVGHGIGRDMHEDPQVPNYGRPGRGPLLEEGMVLAVEPMMTAGRAGVRVAGDGWAIFSQDGSPAAHFEFTVAITAAGSAHPHPLAPAARGASSARRASGCDQRRLRWRRRAAPGRRMQSRPRCALRAPPRCAPHAARDRALLRRVATIRSPARTRDVCAREGTLSTTW